ncbi:chromosome segregation in meiosis-related protein [Paecilomyces lecythidis]
MNDVSDADVRPHNDLFDYDVGLDEVLGEISERNSAPNRTSSNQAASAQAPGLGLDEEVVVTKKRQPIAKLDESLILSQKGIPRLRSTAKKLRFKGKGHEFSDAARLLNFYQLWLDDLFPRAKFADGLSMIERLGHSKRIQVMRRQWIDEGRPDYRQGDDSIDQDNSYSTTLVEETTTAPRTEQRPSEVTDNAQTMETDGLTSLERDTIERRPNYTGDDGRLFMSDDEDMGNETRKEAGGEDMPEEDELDALLAEQEMQDNHPHRESAPQAPVEKRPPEEDFEDDLEAMGDSNIPW